MFSDIILFFQEKPQTLPATERAEQPAGVVVLQEPNVQAVGQLSLWAGHESNSGHGTAQSSHPGLAGPAHDFTELLHGPGSRGYATHAQGSRLSRGVRSRWALAHAECHI